MSQDHPRSGWIRLVKALGASLLLLWLLKLLAAGALA